MLSQMGGARGEVLAEAVGVSMAFGGAQVLHKASLQLRAGEVHGITGENGAGKSTLAKILTGLYRPTAGRVDRHGLASHEVALVPQEPQTFEQLTAAENIFAGRLLRTRWGLVDWRSMREEAGRLLAGVECRCPPEVALVGATVADRQMVEVAAALAQDAKVIIFDETTASLTPKEAEDLFRVIRRLREEGRAIAIVSHRLDELFALCDRITVLRDGEIVAESLIAETTIPEIVRLMVGRDMSLDPALAVSAGTGAQVLEVQDLTVQGRVHGVTFQVCAGEIVALAGLVGSGRTDIAHAIGGVTTGFGGRITLKGKAFAPGSPSQAWRAGVALVPEDRQHHGLLLPMSIEANIGLPVLPRKPLAWLPHRRERDHALGWIERLRVVCRGPDQPVGRLSGGNQQKGVIAKALEAKPRLLIIDEPTRGVDVGAKAEVHRLLRELTGEGLAVLMVSSDLPEVLALADRTLVIRAGRIAAEFGRSDIDADRVMFAATGQEVHHA